MPVPSRLKLTLWLALLLAALVQLPGAAQPPKSALPGIPPGWAPPPDQRQYWQTFPDRMRLTVPPKTGNLFKLISSQKLNPASFSIDFWVAEYSDSFPCNIGFDIGDVPHAVAGKIISRDGTCLSLIVGNGTVSIDGLDNMPYNGLHTNSRSVLRWVRITYHQATEQMAIYINGQPVSIRNKVRFTGETPLSLIIYPSEIADKPQEFDVFGIRVTDKFLPQPASLPGIAYQGWKNLPATPQPDALPDGLEDAIDSLLNDPKLTPRGRGYALATKIMADRVGTGVISPKTWDELRLYLNQQPIGAQSEKSLVLPIAIASAKADQREQLAPEVQSLFAPMIAQYNQVTRAATVTERAATLDIGRTAMALFYLPISAETPPELVDDAIPVSPEIALGLELQRANAKFSSTRVIAWDMAKLHAISPEFHQIARILFGELGLRGPRGFRSEPDASLSLAAYQAAVYDPNLAVAYWNMIRDLKLRDQTLTLMIEGLPPATLSDEAASRVKAGLQDAITRWKPDGWEKSVMPLYYQLAHFEAGRGLQDDAVLAVGQAVEKLGDTRQASFRDVWLIALNAYELKLKKAPAWFNAALDRAGQDRGWGGNTDFKYQRASQTQMTMVALLDLAKQGKGAEVLTLVKALGSYGLGPNSDAKYAALIDVLADTAPAYAYEVWKQMPAVDPQKPFLPRFTTANDVMDRPKDKVLYSLGKKLLARDRKTTIELLYTMKPGAEGAALAVAVGADMAKNTPDDLPDFLDALSAVEAPNIVREIAKVTPVEDTPELMDILSEGLKRDMAGHRVQTPELNFQFVDKYAGIGLSTMLALQPVCTDNPDLYAAMLLTGMMKTAGLQDDPLWRRLWHAETAGAFEFPDIPSDLPSAAESLDPADRFKKAAP